LIDDMTKLKDNLQVLLKSQVGDPVVVSTAKPTPIVVAPASLGAGMHVAPDGVDTGRRSARVSGNRAVLSSFQSMPSINTQSLRGNESRFFKVPRSSMPDASEQCRGAVSRHDSISESPVTSWAGAPCNVVRCGSPVRRLQSPIVASTSAAGGACSVMMARVHTRPKSSPDILPNRSTQQRVALNAMPQSAATILTPVQANCHSPRAIESGRMNHASLP